MIKTEGIVLKDMKYRDSSKIITIYTEKEGKISVMARGAYNPKSRLISTTQAFGLNEYQFRKGKTFYYINQSDVLDSHYAIREDIERVSYGYYILELLDKSIPEEQANDKIFKLLKEALRVLAGLKDDYIKFIVGYEIKYISFLGYRPFLERCVNCESEKAERIKFSIEKGGIICEKCFTKNRYALSLSKEIYDLMYEVLYTPLEELKDVEGNLNDFTMLHDILVKYILHNIDRPKLNSLMLLDDIVDYP